MKSEPSKNPKRERETASHSLDRMVRPEGKRERQIWDAASVICRRERIPTAPWRYIPEEVRLSMAQSIRQWWNGLKNLEWNWIRTGLVMRPIKPGEPEYDGAPYEMAVVFHRDVMRTQVGPNVPDERPGELK